MVAYRRVDLRRNIGSRMRGSVQRYNFYLLDQTGFLNRALEARLSDDAAALSHAAAIDHPHAVEIAQARRIVGKVWPKHGTRVPARPGAAQGERTYR